MNTNQTNEAVKTSPVRILINIICALVGLGLTALLLWNILHSQTSRTDALEADPTEPVSVTMMDTYDTFIDGIMDEAYKAAKSVRKIFWIDEDASVPPKADPAKYGETDDPTTLQWLLDDAAELLEGQDMTFSTDVKILEGSKITYYLDDSILAITWKEVHYNFVYTLTEVKVAHPSQVRRYIAEETYGSDYLYEPTEMAAMMNAVAAISGDYYRGRNYGIVVYDGVVYQASAGKHVDTCYVDRNGDFHFTFRGDIMDMESAQKFVDEHDISFSLAFGPVLVDDGVRCEPASYALGEVNDCYPRAAICQKDKLHYILVAANWESYYYDSPDIHTLAEVVAGLNVEKAYTLDGGKTGAIAMDGKLMNHTHNLRQRAISEIVYFATAIPDGSGEE